MRPEEDQSEGESQRRLRNRRPVRVFSSYSWSRCSAVQTNTLEEQNLRILLSYPFFWPSVGCCIWSLLNIQWIAAVATAKEHTRWQGPTIWCFGRRCVLDWPMNYCVAFVVLINIYR